MRTVVSMLLALPLAAFAQHVEVPMNMNAPKAQGIYYPFTNMPSDNQLLLTNTQPIPLAKDSMFTIKGGAIAQTPILTFKKSGDILVRGKPATDAEIVEALREYARKQ